MVSRISGGSAQQPIATAAESASIENEVMVMEVQKIAEQTQQPKHEEQITRADAQKATEGMNKLLESVNTQLRFKFHDKLNEYYVTIVDSKTDEVVREIPPKKLMDMYAAMKDFVGLLVDRKI